MKAFEKPSFACILKSNDLFRMADSEKMNGKGAGMPISGSWLKKSFGIFFVLLGLVLHLIPFFPASWIIILGLELLGIRMLAWERLRTFMEERGIMKAKR